MLCSFVSLADPSLTVARVFLILTELEEWSSFGPFTIGGLKGFNFVPLSRSDIIRRQHTSIVDQKKEAATYYVTCSPDASWGNLAWYLYQTEEKRAVEAFKSQLPKPKGNQCDLSSEWMQFVVTEYIMRCDRFCFQVRL